MLLPKDEARLLRRNLQGSPLATPQPSLQLQSSEVLQSACDVRSPSKALPDRPVGKGAAKLGQEQEALSQQSGSNWHSSASPCNDQGPVAHLGCAVQTAAPDGTQTCAEGCERAELESQHGAEQNRRETAAIQDDLKGNFEAKALTTKKGKGAALACSRFHVDSLKTLQRRVVAKKRKRRSISVAGAEDNDSAASSCGVATMTFIEPHSWQAGTHIEDRHQAKKQCQQSAGQHKPSMKCF